VLLVQDTTFLNYGTTQPKAGMGTVKLKTREEYLLHPTVAFTPERVNVGVVGMQVWQRPAQPVAQQRKRKPLEEKERYRWLAGYHCACEVKQACPATVVVNMANREGDLQAWLVDTRRREPDQRAECLSPATCNRRLASGAAPRYLWAEMQRTHSLGTLTIALARQPGRPPRPVTLAVTAKPVTFQGGHRPGGQLPPVTGSAVYAQEPSSPQGEAPIEGLLLTSRPVTDFPRACTVVQWYRCRWQIELFFRVLKQGCQIEQLRVQTEQRLLNALAMYSIVAWRIHIITMAVRAYPEGSCEVVFEPQEWYTLYTMQPHCHPPRPRPHAVRWCGVSHSSAGAEPGIKAIWQGYQRLHEFIYARDTYRTVNAQARNV
jgi:Transposase DDE domain